MFPYVMYASMYRDLAASAGLYYYRIQSLKPPNVSGAAALLYADEFINSCDGEKRHISSPAAFLDYECNWRSKSSPWVERARARARAHAAHAAERESERARRRR